MRVLFSSYSGLLGGAERLLVDLGSDLGEAAFLACPPGPLADHAAAAGLRVLQLRERRLELRASAIDRLAAPLRVAGHARELRRLAEALAPDLIAAWGMRSLLAWSLALRGRRRGARLVFQHNDLLPGPFVGGLVRAAAGRADRVVAVSETVARDLDPSGRLGERVAVVAPGVDLERFRPAPLPEGRALVLGALVDWKRPELALSAAEAAAARVPELRLRLAGAPLGGDEDGLLERLRERAAESALAGRVEFPGAVDPAAALADTTCLLHCADREPFGMVVLEALAAGRPVVAPASGGPAELVDAGVGRLYPPGDAGAAGAALAEVLATPGLADSLGGEGRRRAEASFGLARSRERWRAAALPAGARSEPDGAGLALVTVTHDSKRDLARLLRSAATHLPAARVVVVDSGSGDGSAELARRAGADVIELGANVGFGRASNRGLEEISEPVAALVNPDVELLDASLADLARDARNADRILAPLVLNPDGSRQETAHPEPGSWPELLKALVPPAALPRAVATAPAPWRSRRPRRVGWAVGCCLVARTDLLRRLGPFDERIFLYGEDLELGLRAAAAGVETWFCPDRRVIHRGAHSSELSFGGEPFERLARARREVIARRLGPGRAQRDDRAQLVTFAGRVALKTLLGRPSARERRQLAALLRVRREPLPVAER